MGLLSILLGHNRLRRANPEQYFSIVTAVISLGSSTDLRVINNAGIIFNPVESSFFANLNSEIDDLLHISQQSTGTEYQITDDSFETRWVILKDPDFEDLTSTIHLIGETMPQRCS